jgi:hypothetical protein
MVRCLQENETRLRYKLGCCRLMEIVIFCYGNQNMLKGHSYWILKYVVHIVTIAFWRLTTKLLCSKLCISWRNLYKCVTPSRETCISVAEKMQKGLKPSLRNRGTRIVGNWILFLAACGIILQHCRSSASRGQLPRAKYSARWLWYQNISWGSLQPPSLHAQCVTRRLSARMSGFLAGWLYCA